MLCAFSACGRQRLQRFGQLSHTGQFGPPTETVVWLSVQISWQWKETSTGKQRNRSSFRETEWSITKWSVPVSEWPHPLTKGHYRHCLKFHKTGTYYRTCCDTEKFSLSVTVLRNVSFHLHIVGFLFVLFCFFVCLIIWMLNLHVLETMEYFSWLF